MEYRSHAPRLLLLTCAVTAEPPPHSAIRKRGQSNFRDEAPRKKTLTPFAGAVITDGPVTPDKVRSHYEPTANCKPTHWQTPTNREPSYWGQSFFSQRPTAKITLTPITDHGAPSSCTKAAALAKPLRFSLSFAAPAESRSATSAYTHPAGPDTNHPNSPTPPPAHGASPLPDRRCT